MYVTKEKKGENLLLQRWQLNFKRKSLFYKLYYKEHVIMNVHQMKTQSYSTTQERQQNQSSEEKKI